LINLYSVIAVNLANFPDVNYGLAKKFIDWITSITIQKEIYEYRSETGAHLFYPVDYDFSKKK
jgi:ABC-type tungstate transport system permease subunit